MISNNSKRVIKNTLSLYIRTAILTVVSLFSSRIVLRTLGVDDFGLNNVVGGIVTMFSFVVGSLSNATQRFFAFDLAVKDWKKIRKTYSIVLGIFIILILIILLLSESVGLWFVLNKLNVARDRVFASFVVYECSIFTFITGIISTPYIALLTADENLSIYSFVSVIEAILKLALVFVLSIVSFDKLIAYALLMLAVSIAINGYYLFYTKNKYPLLRFELCKNVSEYKSMFSYQSWNLIGSIASVLKNQGISIVINLFFGTAMNAARGISTQVNSSISSFSLNFMKAINPQITKSYGNEEHDRFNKLMLSASKLSFFLLFVISVPVIFDIDYILKLWLDVVPDYTAVFVRLALIDAIISSTTESISTGVQSIGKIKLYQAVVGGTLLLNVPISYAFLSISSFPVIPFIVSIIISVICNIERLLCIKRIYRSFSLHRYILKVLLPIMVTASTTTVIILILLNHSNSFGTFIINVVLSISISGLSIFIVGLDSSERKAAIQIIKNRLNFGKQV